MLIAALVFAFGLALVLLNTLMQRAADRLARVHHSAPSGTAFDVAPVRPRISTVRRNYVAELESHPHLSDYHAELLESARHAVAQLPFFRTRTEAAIHEDAQTWTA
jgi:hypothetical protein